MPTQQDLRLVRACESNVGKVRQVVTKSPLGVSHCAIDSIDEMFLADASANV